jgi:hypothetical protein
MYFILVYLRSFLLGNEIHDDHCNMPFLFLQIPQVSEKYLTHIVTFELKINLR